MALHFQLSLYNDKILRDRHFIGYPLHGALHPPDQVKETSQI